MKEKAKIRKAVYIAVMWCILASVLLGCRKSNVESYASAEEAKQAMSQCRTFLVEGDLDEVNQEGNILADGKIAGRLKETGILNTKWTVSVDGKTWFWMKFVTDEPINNIDGVIAGTTYGYYDENNQCLGYAQKRLFENENLEREYYLVFMDEKFSQERQNKDQRLSGRRTRRGTLRLRGQSDRQRKSRTQGLYWGEMLFRN